MYSVNVPCITAKLCLLCSVKIHVFPAIEFITIKTIKRLEYHRNNALFIAKILLSILIHTHGHILKAKAPCVQTSFRFSLCPEGREGGREEEYLPRNHFPDHITTPI